MLIRRIILKKATHQLLKARSPLRLRRFLRLLPNFLNNFAECFLPLKTFPLLQRLIRNILALRANFDLFGYFIVMEGFVITPPLHVDY